MLYILWAFLFLIFSIVSHVTYFRCSHIQVEAFKYTDISHILISILESLEFQLTDKCFFYISAWIPNKNLSISKIEIFFFSF